VSASASATVACREAGRVHRASCVEECANARGLLRSCRWRRRKSEVAAGEWSERRLVSFAERVGTGFTVCLTAQRDGGKRSQSLGGARKPTRGAASLHRRSRAENAGTPGSRRTACRERPSQTGHYTFSRHSVRYRNPMKVTTSVRAPDFGSETKRLSQESRSALRLAHALEG